MPMGVASVTSQLLRLIIMVIDLRAPITNPKKVMPADYVYSRSHSLLGLQCMRCAIFTSLLVSFCMPRHQRIQTGNRLLTTQLYGRRGYQFNHGACLRASPPTEADHDSFLLQSFLEKSRPCHSRAIRHRMCQWWVCSTAHSLLRRSIWYTWPLHLPVLWIKDIGATTSTRLCWKWLCQV